MSGSACRPRLGVTSEKLQKVGVETLAIVATSVENARLYFRFRPTRAPQRRVRRRGSGRSRQVPDR